MVKRKREIIETRDENGRAARIVENEPIPKKAKTIRSRTVSRKGLKLAAVRLKAEAILHGGGCGGVRVAEQLAKLGNSAAPVLIKIASSDHRCLCGSSPVSGAVRALGHFPEPAVLDFLQEAVVDGSQTLGVRSAAALSLGRIGSPSCVKTLCQVLSKDRSDDLRRSAAQGLALSRSLDGVHALEAAVETDKNSVVKLQAFGAIKELETHFRERLSSVKQPPLPKVAAPKPEKPPRGFTS